MLVSVTPEVVLLNHGESLPGLYPRPEGVHRPNVNPHSPIWHAGQEQLDIPADTWAREVLDLSLPITSFSLVKRRAGTRG